MAVYHYKAKKKGDKIVKGILTASNVSELKSELKNDGLLLISAKEDTEKKSFFRRKSLRLSDKVSLCRYMGLIIKSGMSFSEGLNLIANGTNRDELRYIVNHVSEETREGKSLYESFKRYEDQFDEAFLTIIKTGEKSGTLAESFTYLANHYQMEKELKGKVLSALLYPVIIIGLMFAVGVILFTFVLPRLADVFSKMDIDLPIYTKLLFSTSLFFQKNMIFVLITAGIIVLAIVYLIRGKAGRKIALSIMHRMPVVKNLLRDYNLVRFTQSLSVLLKSGVPVTEAVELSVQTLSIPKRESISKTLKEKLMSGVSMSRSFREAKIFPPLMIQLIMIGEKTGNLETMLLDLSSFYEEEVEESLKKFITALEPTLMILVGIGVGAMVISVISPIYSLVGQIQAGL